MRTSQLLLATLKESPQDAELISHQLMLRAGLIRKLASGLYTWLPLGLRVLRKVEQVVREEMNAIHAQELLMPVVQPAELWEETDRWEQFGPQLLKIKDRHNRSFCFGPTHEEVITDLVRNELQSYKELPCCFYQIQTKFRDEIRPRFGVMRAREFLMKDAYSFHMDQASLQETYDAMYQAYSKIFDRLGLTYRSVLADTGAIGGSLSHEFHVLADSGEDAIAYCDNSDYAANVEAATTQKSEEQPAPATQDMHLCDTPNIRSVKEQAKFMGLETQQIIKTLLVKGINNSAVALLLRGDDELNTLKAEKHELVHSPLMLIDEQAVTDISGCQPGFVGPMDLNIPIVADYTVLNMSDFSCGANTNDKHYIGVNWERDLPVPSEQADLRTAKAGDTSPDGKGSLSICRGIEVGHIFQLGNKYSKSMQATVLNDKGQAVAPEMGCYGIGVSRIVAAAIEQNYDENGIIWPGAMAPFSVILVPLKYNKSHRVREAAMKIYDALKNNNVEVLLDDRSERPGRMFAEADLIGFPHRIVIGERGLDDGIVEYKARHSSDIEKIKLDNVLYFLQGKFKAD